MQSIFAAIGTALRAAFTVLRAVISLPGRLVVGLLGGSAAPPPAGDSPLVQELQAELDAEGDRMKKNAENIAAIVAAWCADCLIAGRPLPAPTPPHVPRAVSDWLPGLTREECTEIVCAAKQAVFEHIEGRSIVSGVRPVQRLDAIVEWSPEPACVEPAPGFELIAPTGRAAPSLT